MADLAKTVDTITSMLTVVLGSIAGISLLVGGIGIMNMMLTNVTQRIREIGLRKAVGATRSDITSQFLAEAVALTMVGGLIGTALAWGISAAVTAFSTFDMTVTAAGATGVRRIGGDRSGVRLLPGQERGEARPDRGAALPVGRVFEKDRLRRAWHRTHSN